MITTGPRPSRLAARLLALLLLGLLGACATVVGADFDKVQPQCDSGRADCDGSASTGPNGCEVSVATDIRNCGGCGRVCPAAGPHAQGLCESGACGFACQAGFRSCGGSPGEGCATEVATDPQNCGDCGAACANPHGTLACAGGKCAPACAPGFAACGDPARGCETDTSKPENCGGCGHACMKGGLCQAGSCACPPGMATVCGAECVDLQSDSANCGGCGKACPKGGSCVKGSCVCPSGTTDCPGASSCVDTQKDAAHCGGCGMACGPNADCASGACACKAGSVKCGADCADLKSDPSHCGSCGHACATGKACLGGQCCSPSPIAGGACDPAGGCGCAPGEACYYSGGKAPSTVCAAPGSGAPFSPCTSSSDCAAGSDCPAVHVCSPLCSTDAECVSKYGAGGHCVQLVNPADKTMPIPGDAVCFPGCSPVQGSPGPYPPCPGNEACDVFVDPQLGAVTDCQSPGSKPEGAACNSNAIGDCAAGLYCDTSSVCRRYCWVKQPSMCAPPEKCEGFTTSVLIGGQELGACTKPVPTVKCGDACTDASECIAPGSICQGGKCGPPQCAGCTGPGSFCCFNLNTTDPTVCTFTGCCSGAGCCPM